jgi:dihydrofolate reductase
LLQAASGVTNMAREYSIEAYAIISADGMIANAAGVMPPELKVDADQRFFRAALDSAAAVALGRVTHEQERNLGRRRLVLTRRVSGLAPDPNDHHALFWNPAGATWEAARVALGLRQGSLAVIGGADVYAVFLPIGYDAFHLTRANRAQLPGGYPVFPNLAPDRSPEDVLKEHGLRPGPLRLLDPAAGVTLVTWTPGRAD